MLAALSDRREPGADRRPLRAAPGQCGDATKAHTEWLMAITVYLSDIEHEHMTLVVKKSPLHGKGLFASKDIPWGFKIIEYKGQLVSDALARKRIAEGADCIFELGDDANIDGAVQGNDARYINHARTKTNCFVLRD